MRGHGNAKANTRDDIEEELSRCSVEIKNLLSVTQVLILLERDSELFVHMFADMAENTGVEDLLNGIPFHLVHLRFLTNKPIAKKLTECSYDVITSTIIPAHHDVLNVIRMRAVYNASMQQVDLEDGTIFL